MQSGSGGGSSGGGGDFVGSFSQAMASKKASDDMKKYLKRAAALWQQEREYQRKLFQPYVSTGQEAQNKLWEMVQAGPGEYEKSPYYDFLVGEGTKALERGAAARGRTFSGAQAKALTKYGEDVASLDYDNWLRRWYQSLVPYESLANKGLQATGAYSGASIQTTNELANIAQNLGAVNAAQWMNLGNLMASNQRSIGNSITSSMGGISSMFGGGGMGGGIGGYSQAMQPMNQNWLNQMYSPLRYYRG